MTEVRSYYGRPIMFRVFKVTSPMSVGCWLLGRRRAGASAGGALLLGGGVSRRWSIFKAGFASARDPKDTVPQRRRVEARARR
ncbi:MAG TPA: hypothetical protein VGQ84_02255 [Gaiellaceae bacterium]|nr:hypothetical protein [Gaiellaceae bacterium]